MKQEKAFVNEDAFHHKRTCLTCFCKKEKVPEKEGMYLIKAQHIAADQSRAESYKHAREHVQEAFPMLGGTKSEKRQFVLDFMCTLYSPLIEIIRRKQEIMDSRQDIVEKITSKMDAWRTCTDPMEAGTLLQQVHELEDALEESKKEVAFRRFGPELQQQFLAASQYDDEWTRISDQAGRLTVFRAYYICKGNGWRMGPTSEWLSGCNSMTVSKVWKKRWPDEANGQMSEKTKQRWYCPVCGGRYKASWGMMIQIVTDFDTPKAVDFNCLAEVPSFDIEDIKAMQHEKSLTHSNPMKFFKEIPDRLPCLASGVLRAATDVECQHAHVAEWALDDVKPKSYGVYVLTEPKALEALPMFQWNQIFNFAGLADPTPKKK